MRRITCYAGSADNADIISGKIKQSGVPIFSIDISSDEIFRSHPEMTVTDRIISTFLGMGYDFSEQIPDTKAYITVTCPDSSEYRIRQLMISGGALSVKTM